MNTELPSPERPTLLLLVASLQGGGAERQLSDMASYWVAQGWRVLLATWSGPETEDFYALDRRVERVHLHVEMQRHGVFSTLHSTLKRILKLRRFLASNSPDAVLSFVTESNVLAILAATGLNIRVVVSERVHPGHHLELSAAWRFLRKHVYALSDVVVAQTQDAAHWLQRDCGKRVVVIPNALRPLPHPQVARLRLIVAIGRLANQKGFDLLLKALARMDSAFDDWRAVIIGEGPERGNLIDLRNRLGLAQRVEFVGQTTDVEYWIARAGLVIQPSRFEGFPNVVLESMGMGAAVIAADCPSGPSELITDGFNGRLVPVDNVDALERTMAELMSQPQIRARLGREATMVRQRFNQDLILAQWQACLLPQSARSRSDGRSA